MHFPGVDHTGSDGEDGGARPGEGDVVADPSDEAADYDGGEGVAYEVGDRAYARTFGGGAFDGLEVEGYWRCKYSRRMGR